MRFLFCLSLLVLSNLANAGSIRPAACLTSAEEDPGLKDYLRLTNQKTCERLNLTPKCTDAEAKAVDPTAVIFTISISSFQDSTSSWYCDTVKGQAAAGIAWRNAKQIQDLYAAATPEERAQVDLILKVPQP